MASLAEHGAAQDPNRISRALLGWYDVAARALPWRQPPGIRPDPYAVWLSEIMLQQTTVKAVIPFYRKFLARWPRVEDLAAADLNDILAAWAGLGYYSRARNLHACAKAVAEQHGGRFPTDAVSLQKLPGIGAYTSAAIAAIAFDQPETAVDGNVERVVARLFALETPLPAAKPEIKRLASRLTPQKRPGDFTQAMMDLGATICSPRSPSCLICPLADSCLARARGIEAQLPAKMPKAERPRRYGAAFVAIRSDGAVLLRRRPPRGLLGGMLEVPSTEWGAAMPDAAEVLRETPVKGEWRKLGGLVSHTFTHFHLELEVYRAERLSEASSLLGADWHPHETLAEEALPSVMMKVLAHALPEPISRRR